MLKNKKFFDKLIYFVPAIIVLAIMLIVFFVKRMYPFSLATTLQIDADFNYIPALYKIHDIFHYGDSILWDFKIGAGANLYGAFVISSIYSPLNWLVIFVQRSNIVQFFNILVIIKFMFMATTMFFFIRKNFSRVSNYWQIVLSVLFVFSGWTLLLYSNIFFIDCIIVFPIVMHFFIKLFKEGKCLGFILALTYSLILNVYFSYMIYLFIVFSSLLALILLVEKDKRKKIIFNLSFSLVIPLLLSAFSWAPAVSEIFDSIRSSSGGYGSYFGYFFLKVVYITMSSFIVVMFFKYIKTYKFTKDKKVLFYLILFVITTIGIIIEPVNRAWHIGSYRAFPYRYSFIPIFILICGSLEYLGFNECVSNKKMSINRVVVLMILCLSVMLYFVFKYNTLMIERLIAYNIVSPGLFLVLMFVFIMFIMCYLYCFFINDKKDRMFIFSLLILLEVFIYCNWCFNDYNQRRSFVASEYKDEVKYDDKYLYKYSHYQGDFVENGSYIFRKATLSNWFHLIPKKQMDFAKNFGYSYQGPIIYGYGGVVFSDILVGVNNFYSNVKLSDEFYNYVRTSTYDNKDVYIYSNKYDSSFGMFYDEPITDVYGLNHFDTQNYYYKKLFGKELIKVIEYSSDDSSLKSYSYKLKNSDDIILYLDVSEELLESEIDEVSVNGMVYDVGFFDKTLYLGQFKSDVNIGVKIRVVEDTNFNGITFGYIKKSDLKKVSDYFNVKYDKFEYFKNRLNIKLHSDKKQYLFLPINNINGWSLKVNGESRNIQDVLYTFMGIELDEGDNVIELEFYPPYLKEGIIISSVSVLIFALFMLFKEKIYNISIFSNIVMYLYYFVSISLFIFIYVISNFIFI